MTNDSTEFRIEQAPGPGTPVIISVCITCRSQTDNKDSPPGSQFFDAVTRADWSPDVIVRPVQCLGVCKRPVTVAISAPDGYTFLFGDLNLDTGPAALRAFIESYKTAHHGLVPWRKRPEPIRRGLVARLPPSVWSPPDGRPPA